MLKHISPLLGPDLLHALRQMGHGDEIAIVDANFPAYSQGPRVVRLDGVDAPELDQICIDDHADPWSCGVEARDQLTKLIAGRAVQSMKEGPFRVLINLNGKEDHVQRNGTIR